MVLKILFLLHPNKTKEKFTTGKIDKLLETKQSICHVLKSNGFHDLDILRIPHFPTPNFRCDDDYILEFCNPSTIHHTIIQQNTDVDSFYLTDINILYAFKIKIKHPSAEIFFSYKETLLSSIKNNKQIQLGKFIGKNFNSIFLPNETQSNIPDYDKSQDEYLFFQFLQYELSFKRKISIYPPVELITMFNDRQYIHKFLLNQYSGGGPVTLPSLIFDFPYFEGLPISSWKQLWKYLSERLLNQPFQSIATKKNKFNLDNPRNRWYGANLDLEELGIEIIFLQENGTDKHIFLQMHKPKMHVTASTRHQVVVAFSPTSCGISYENEFLEFERFTQSYTRDIEPLPSVKCLARPNTLSQEKRNVNLGITFNPPKRDYRFRFMWADTTFEQNSLKNGLPNIKEGADLCESITETLMQESKLTSTMKKFSFLMFKTHSLIDSKNPEKEVFFIKDVNLIPTNLPTLETTITNDIIDLVSSHAIQFFEDELGISRQK